MIKSKEKVKKVAGDMEIAQRIIKNEKEIAKLAEEIKQLKRLLVALVK